VKRLLILIIVLIAPMDAGAQDPSSPILRTELEKDTAIPGQPIILRVTVLAPTWLPKPPVFPSFEIPNVIVRLPSRASGPVSERVGAETWSGVTRAYRLYPMVTGRFRISPKTVSVTYADPKDRKPVSVDLRTAAIGFAGIAPEGAKGLDPFIAANAVILEQAIDGDPTDLQPGDAITRTLIARIKGTSPIFLPPLITPLAAEALSAYPKEPVVNEIDERGIFSGDRVESVTYVATAGGRYTASPIRLRWFNLDENRIETAEADGFDFVVRGALPASRQTMDWLAIAPWLIGAVFFILVASMVIVRLWPFISAWRRRRRKTKLASEAWAFAQASAALRAHDFPGAVRAIELWSSRLGLVSGAADERLAQVLANIGAAMYGPGQHTPSNQAWSGAVRALLDARRALLAASSVTHGDRALPPLNPRQASSSAG